MTTFKKSYQQPNFTPTRAFFHQLTMHQRGKVSFFIILITSIFRNKSQTLYAVSCTLNLPQLLQYIPPCTESTIPPWPNKMPFTLTDENVPKLEQYLCSNFFTTAFSKSSPFPSMSAQPAYIHLKSNAVPYAKHTSILVPFHWKQEVKELLHNHLKNGILQEVPIGTPIQWCSTMVVTAKKDGYPRITVDLQHLNSQCLRETHHTPSPFQIACHIPSNTKKSVFDTVDGFRAILLDKESQTLTFITEWWRYMYLQLPQDFLASTNA